MPNSSEPHPPSHRASALGRWIYQTIALRGLQVKHRLRGNTLHILCEGTVSPERTTVLLWLLPALKHTDLGTLIPADAPQIYQVQLYGCKLGQRYPDWTASIYLNQLDRHLEQLQHTHQPAAEYALSGMPQHSNTLHRAEECQPTDGENASARAPVAPPLTPSVFGPETSDPIATDRAALAMTNRSLAKRGQEMALASYLSETLSGFGVAVRVSVKTVPYMLPAAVRTSTPTAIALTAKRLWVACEATYSPDPALIGEPISQKLRDLELEGYRDAVIQFQVAGEPQPDWRLRVDLTPANEMLREWGRWGDVEAIQRLLNQAIEPLSLQIISASLKDSTLHLVCSEVQPAGEASSIDRLDRSPVKARILSLLETLGPQGIQSAALYGQQAEETPAWVEWLELPAAIHPALADAPFTLAQEGDWGAIAFLMHRLLNPELDKYLATGGIRLQLLPKQDLLHIMSEAPLCPQQRQIGPTIARFLRQLKLPDLSGVRIYGRRAGQKHPLWSYGADFIKRDRLVPEATPDFAVTDAFIHDLVTPSGEPAIRPDLTPTDVQAAWKDGWQRAISQLQQTLIRSRLFIPDQTRDDGAIALAGQVPQQGLKTLLVSGAAGLLLLVPGNWLLSQQLRAKPTSAAARAPVPEATTNPVVPVASSTLPTEPSPETALPAAPSSDGSADAFNPDGFTQSVPTPPDRPAAKLPFTAQRPEVMQAAAAIVATTATLPSFNSNQLDDKLKLYYRYLEDKGHPPTVMIVGSSRALRGVDPVALRQSLAKLGYADVDIFNFGINGATAQVVDLIVQRLLTPEQLPQLILWADGARAFNSGATDVTYNGIAASEAYRQLAAGQLALPNPTGSPTASARGPEDNPPAQSLNTSLTSSYEALDRWLSQRLAAISGTYDDRDRLKHRLQRTLVTLLPTPDAPASTAYTLHPDQALMDTEGFLSLAIQFNPATYYQKYAKVSGEYDGDYASFQISGKQESALNSLLQFTQARQIPVVFVNLPLTEDYLDPFRRQHEQTFKEYMVKRSMNQSGFTFRDLGELWTTEYAYFSDPSHLNRYGAYAISQRLAQDPLIPWSKPQTEGNKP